MKDFDGVQSGLNSLFLRLGALSPLTPDERSVLESACSRTVRFDADQDVLREGDRPVGCGVLLDGWMCRYKDAHDGRRQIMSFHFQGDLFDAQSFILDLVDHSIGTLTPCTVAFIPRETMLDIVENYPRLNRAIWRETLLESAVFREWVVNVGLRDATEALAHLICEVFIRRQTVGLTDGDTTDWPLTQTELGYAVGLSNVHVNRTLQELRRRGLIVLGNGKLEIRDLDGLREAGHFNPDYLHRRSNGDGRSAGEQLGV